MPKNEEHALRRGAGIYAQSGLSRTIPPPDAEYRPSGIRANQLPSRVPYPPSRTKPLSDEVLMRDYVELKPRVISAVYRRLHCSRSDSVDLEGCYQNAWITLEKQLVDTEIENMMGFLIKITYCRAIDELRRTRPRQRLQIDVEEFSWDDNPESRMDHTRQLLALCEAVCSLLSGLEYEAAVLCLLRGYRRAEAAKELGLSRPQIERVMDSVFVKLRPAIERIRADDWCRTYTSSLRALRCGLLSREGSRGRVLKAHLRYCSACRLYLREA